jgi:REP element-mobilizing transposase RayT
MARIGRFVVPDLARHVTQCGNRRERVFVGDDDYGWKMRRGFEESAIG